MYRGTGILEVVRFASSPTPSPPPPVSKLYLFLSLSVCQRSSLLKGVGVVRGGSQIIRSRESLVLYNNLILSFPTPLLHLDRCREKIYNYIDTYKLKGIILTYYPII